MRISSAIEELATKTQIYNIPLLPVPSNQPNQSLTILNLQDAVQTAVDILYHLRDEECLSYETFRYAEAIKEYGISVDGSISQEILDTIPNALLWKQQFRANFLSRLSTYTMTIYGLDKMLEMTYQKFMEALSNTTYKKSMPIENLPDEKRERDEILKPILKPRRDEIAHYRKLRDKVFAHTSYADPRRDSEELQSASLAFYSGFNMKYMKDCVYIQIDPPLYAIGNQVELSIFKDYFETVIPHYDNWSTMFTSILEQISVAAGV